MGLRPVLSSLSSISTNKRVRHWTSCDNDVQDCIHSYVNNLGDDDDDDDDLSWDDLVFAFGDGSRIVVGEMPVLAWDCIVR